MQRFVLCFLFFVLMADLGHLSNVTQEWVKEFIESTLMDVMKDAATKVFEETQRNYEPEEILQDSKWDNEEDQRQHPPFFEKSEEAIKDIAQKIGKRGAIDNHVPELASKSNHVMVFVAGPESSGNRYTVDMIIQAAGCMGKSGHAQPLDHPGKGNKKDWSALNERTLSMISGYTCSVMHRSFPHNNHFVNLKKMAKLARKGGFDPRLLVLLRFMPDVVQSQIQRKHVKDSRKARENIKRAYLEIFDDVSTSGLPFTIASYELLGDDAYVKWMFRELGLPYDASKLPEFKGKYENENK